MDFVLTVGTRHVGVSKVVGAVWLSCLNTVSGSLVSHSQPEQQRQVVKIIMEELSSMREHRAYQQTHRVASISAGRRPLQISKKSKQCCSRCENYNAEPQSSVTRVFLSSRGILEERDNVLLPQREPDRSLSQFYSLNFSSSRMAGNTLQPL